jgi:hypothetical protein
MQLTLRDDDAEILRGLLQDYLPGLKFEVVRTREAELRHVLARRQDVCERLIEELGGPTANS